MNETRWKIKHAVLKTIMHAAQNVYPDEFIALLAGNKKERVINDLIILPSTFGEDFSSIRMDLLPYSAGSMGSVHSHPGYSNRASDADLELFQAYGEIHLIISQPYTIPSIQAYDGKGNKTKFDVIP